jgi:hypothetical protein
VFYCGARKTLNLSLLVEEIHQTFRVKNDGLIVCLLLQVDLALLNVPLPISHLSYWFVALLDGYFVCMLF